MKNKRNKVVVLGASPKPSRYSNQTIKLLLEHGYEVIPVHPKTKEIDTLTLYVSAAISTSLKNQILQLNPARVIFNPGTENPPLNTALKKAEIQTEAACTLILLNTQQF